MNKPQSQKINIAYFSDVLCVWAYIAQARLDQLRKDFSDKINLSCHYVSIFGDTYNKIENNWQDKGGFNGYREHIEKVCQQYDFVSLHSDTWSVARPRSSMSCHLFLKAIELIQQQEPSIYSGVYGRTLVEECAWQMRLAFFRDGRDIAQYEEQIRIAEKLSIPIPKLEKILHDGTAYAQLSNDFELKDQLTIMGSPTFVLNEGRQKLYGNVGYRIIEANILELLETPTSTQASWC